MDNKDKRLLNYIQVTIPNSSRPFREIGEKVGISEDEAIERTKKLKEQGIIRRFGAIFVTPKMGFASALIAAEVPPEKVDEVVDVINSYNLVTHNYMRTHAVNIWFTIMAEDEVMLQATIDELKQKTGFDHFYILRSKKVFKIKAAFNLDTDDDG